MASKLKFLSSLFALVLCLSVSAFGQETAGDIQGTVKDAQGAVVPGVTITIKGIDVGFNRTITTDDQGYYRARQIPAGIYTISAAPTSGFAGQSKENVQVVLGQAATVDFDLSVGGQQAVVNVTDEGGVIIDATDSKVQENITAREIDTLPKGTGFTSLLRTTTAVRAEPLSGQFQINGGSGSENSFILDGQELTNFRTGVLNGNNDIPYQAVQEIQVKSSGFEAEFGGATGGVVSLVTKSGTNQFHGEFGVQFETPELNAGPRPILVNSLQPSFGTTGQFVTYLPQNRDAGTNFFPTGTVSGPVIKDRVWFFAIHSPRYFNTTRATTFIPNPLTGVVADTQTARTSVTNEYSQIKIDATPFNKLRVSSSFTYNPIVQDGILLGGTTTFATVPSNSFGGAIGTLSGADLARSQGGRQNSNNFRIEGVYTPNSSLVALVRYTRAFLNEKLNSYFIPDVRRFRIRQCAGAFAGANCQPNVGAPLNFQNVTNNSTITRDVSLRNQVNIDVSYLVSGLGGRHEFKGGYENNRIFNDVLSGYRNTGRIDLYYGATAYPVGFGAFPTPNFAPSAGSRGVGVLLRIGTQGAAQNKNQALYIQDKWQPFNRLTFNLGVRTEKEDLPAFNGQTTNLQFSFSDKIAPRIGVAFDLSGDGKSRVSAFYGQFFDRLKFELPRGSFGGDFYRVDYFDIPATGPINFESFDIARIIGNYPDQPGGSCTGNGIVSSGLTRCQQDYRIPSNIPGLGFGGVDPDLKPFRQSEFTVEFQRELLANSVFRARYLYRNVDDAVEDSGFRTAGGSEAYVIGNPGQGLYRQLATAAGYQRLATAERRYDAFQAEVDSRYLKNFNFNVNYTYSRLRGNYSGLASSDEDGRTSPGVNRFFDLPFVGFTATGNPDNGRLATDRPHVFKASGSYSYNWFGKTSNETDMTFFTTAQSGTPQTTFVDIFGIPIVKTVRGDLGRSEIFTQTDLNLSHRYRFGQDGRFAVVFDFNVLNLFNENNVLTVDNDESSGYYLLDESEVAPTVVQAVNILTSRGVINELNASVAADPGFNINQSYRLPNLFQTPRSVRFGFRFQF